MPKGAQAYRRPLRKLDYFVIGHRGNGAGPRENTVAHCQDAVAQGADAVEIDVYLRRGRLVVGHPPGRARDELTRLLAEVRAPVILHLKRRWLNPLHDRRAVEQLYLHHWRENLTLSTCWPGTLRHIKRQRYRMRTAFITRWAWYDLWLADRLGVVEFHGWHRTAGRRTARRARCKGIRLIAFVANDERTLRRLTRAGVDGVITDRVRRAAAGR